jgi:hypothetical protein
MKSLNKNQERRLEVTLYLSWAVLEFITTGWPSPMHFCYNKRSTQRSIFGDVRKYDRQRNCQALGTPRELA